MALVKAGCPGSLALAIVFSVRALLSSESVPSFGNKASKIFTQAWHLGIGVLWMIQALHTQRRERSSDCSMEES